MKYFWDAYDDDIHHTVERTYLSNGKVCFSYMDSVCSSTPFTKHHLEAEYDIIRGVYIAEIPEKELRKWAFVLGVVLEKVEIK